jgi:hypothetical protein
MHVRGGPPNPLELKGTNLPKQELKNHWFFCNTLFFRPETTKGTVRPDEICLRVVPLDRPWLFHQLLYRFSIISLIPKLFVGQFECAQADLLSKKVGLGSAKGLRRLLAQHLGEFLNPIKGVHELIGRRILCKPPSEELVPQADLIWPGGPTNQTNVVNQHRLVTFWCCGRIYFSAD